MIMVLDKDELKKVIKKIWIRIIMIEYKNKNKK